jgi:hypothetical protein
MQRVKELEEYNVNLHEEFHALYNGIGPYAPPDAADDDVATDGSDGDVFDPDDGPEE